MKKFEVKLRVEGDITLLPDSQKIFGYLMNKLSGKLSRNEIDRFIKNIKGNCMVSNLMPTGYLPTPKGYLMNLIQTKKKNQQVENTNTVKDEIKELKALIKELNQLKNKNSKNKKVDKKLENQIRDKGKEIDKIKKIIEENASKFESFSAKAIYETIKKMEYIKREDLPKLIQQLNTEEICTDLLRQYDYITKNQKYVQKFKLESQVRKIPGFPNIAYSLPTVEYRNKTESLQKEFSFYVAVEENSILADELQSAKDYKKSIWMFGPKASSGYNCYLLKAIEEFDYIESKDGEVNYLNLGMLLPEEDSICWEESIVNIYSSDRRPFELTENSKKVISFINIGSILVSNQKEAYHIGTSIKNEYNQLYSNAIIFGNSYLEPLEV